MNIDTRGAATASEEVGLGGPVVVVDAEVVAEESPDPTGSKAVGVTELVDALAEADPSIGAVFVGLLVAEVLLLAVEVEVSSLIPKPGSS